MLPSCTEALSSAVLLPHIFAELYFAMFILICLRNEFGRDINEWVKSEMQELILANGQN
jgi:hypothetical protein